MGKGIEAIDGAGHQILVLRHQCLGDVVDAADGGNDPDLVADTHLAIMAMESHEGSGGSLFRKSQFRVIGIFQLSFEICFHIVGMYPVTGGNGRCCMADREAILHNVFSVLNRSQRHLVTLGNLYSSCNAFKYCSSGNGSQGHSHIVIRVDMDKIRHDSSSFIFAGRVNDPPRCFTNRKQTQPERPAPGLASD